MPLRKPQGESLGLEPLRVSVCHCLACQRRNGSAFSAQIRFPIDAVDVRGNWHELVRTADSGRQVTYRFCPDCGSTVGYIIDGWPELLAIPLGLLDDADFRSLLSIHERSKQVWVSITSAGTEHHP